MAVELLEASAARLEFGAIAALGEIEAFTVAFTINTTGTYGGGRLTGQWGDLSITDRAFIISRSGNNITFIVSENGLLGNKAYGETTDDSPFSINALHRIVCRWESPKDMDIWVNGVMSTTTNSFNGSPAKILDAISVVFLGYEAEESAGNVNGDYSEFAIWDHKIPDWMAEAYGVGITPNAYRNGGILYTKAVNTSHLIDEWDANPVTNTNGTTAEHPSMFYQPTQSAISQSAAPVSFQAVTFGARSIIVENGAGVSSSI